MECIFSAVKVCSNLCVGPIPNTSMSFFYYQCVQKNPEYPYLSISAFLVKVTRPNKQFFSAGSLT